MTTVITHAVVGIAVSRSIAAYAPNQNKKLHDIDIMAAIFSVLPDIDVLSFRLGISYGDPLGHRGLSHSISFAALCSIAGIISVHSGNGISRWKRMIVLFLSVLSHPILDMLSNGGLGCAFFAPISWDRYFLPNLLRIIPVSPIGISKGVIGVMAWEMALVWPLAGAAIVSNLLSQQKNRSAVLLGACCFWVFAVVLRIS